MQRQHEVRTRKRLQDMGFNENAINGINTNADEIVEVLGQELRRIEHLKQKVKAQESSGRKHAISVYRTSSVVLLYGLIQSGKTNNVLMTIAKLADLGVKHCIFISHQANALYEQTKIRTESVLVSVFVIEVAKGSDDERESLDNATLQQKPATILVRKNIKLSRLAKLLDAYQNETWVIFDDEADSLALNTFVNKPNHPGSQTYRFLRNLRSKLPYHIYVPVTATPMALEFQLLTSGMRPNRRVEIRPGHGYLGAEWFFNGDHNPFRLVDTAMDRGLLIPSRTASNGLPGTSDLQRMLTSFFVSSVGLLQKDAVVYTSALIHTSVSTSDHLAMAGLVKDFHRMFGQALLPEHPFHREAEQLITTACKDLSKSMALPPIKELMQELSTHMPSVDIQVVNGNRKIKSQLTVHMLMTIFIGGNVLGRGVTVPNLTTTYITRDAQTTYTDTEIQRNRWMGYWGALEGAIRVFTTPELYENMKASHETIREEYQMYKIEEERVAYMANTMHDMDRFSRLLMMRRPLPLPMHLVRGRNRGLCRASVVPKSTIMIRTNKWYYPAHPVSFNLRSLDMMTAKYQRGYQRISLEEAIKLVSLTRSVTPASRGFTKDRNTSWDDDRMLQVLQVYKDRGHTQVWLAIQSKTDIERGSHKPLSENDWSEFPQDGICLRMHRILGRREKGWMDNKARWMPAIHLPESDQVILLQANN